MPKTELPRPTEAELAILRVLWQRGPSTVREVTDALQDERGTGYTTRDYSNFITPFLINAPAPAKTEPVTIVPAPAPKA